MKVTMYVNGGLCYDNELPDEKGYCVDSILISEAENKGGTANVILPRKHPCRDSFRPYSVPVEIYRDGSLRWRGRPLPLKNEDVYGRRTVVCEGELCFLQDAVHRPYAYEGEAAEVFAEVIAVHNAAVEPWKRFAVGNITVEGVVSLGSKKPQNCLEVIKELLAAKGGIVLFDSAEDGSRRINWYKNYPYACTQSVRYGYNLTDYSRSDGSTNFATRIIPYGAADANGDLLTIDVDGKDYVENEDAVAEYGVIEQSVHYSTITDPEELRICAQRDVAASGLVPATIKLSAIDLSRQDRSLDVFRIGQSVPADSPAHNLSGFYYLTSLTEDLVNPQTGGITLQRDMVSYSGSGVRSLTGAVEVSRKGLLSEAEVNAGITAAGAIKNQTQEFIFNKLTNNGLLQALYMLDGEMYINASYLKSGIVDASLVKAGILQSEDGKIQIDLRNGGQGPIFNTGISTNGLVVRGDKVGAAELIRVDAVEVETAQGEQVCTLRFLINCHTGEPVGAISEVFYADSNTPSGIQFRLRNTAKTKMLDMRTGADYAGVYLRDETHGSKVSGYLETFGPEGKSVLCVDRFNPGKKKLFEGTCEVGGTCEVPCTDDFDLFAVRLGDETDSFSTVVFAYKSEDVICGVGGSGGVGEESRYFVFFTASLSGNTWTVESAYKQDIKASSMFPIGTFSIVKEIIGIV